MNILVTGGAGFIGSHLIGRLLSEGNTVVCLDNLDDYYDQSIKRRNIQLYSSADKFRFLETDIRDKDRLDQCFSSFSFDLVVHLAARPGVRPSLLQPELYYDINLMGTLNLLEAMRKHNLSRMVFASSSSVYGDSDKVPFVETDPVNKPISPYAASKKAAELLCHTYHHLYNFDICCLRIFTAYGPRQRPEMAIYRFTEAILRNMPIALYGDGTSYRDYTYVADIVDGIVRSIERIRGYEIINLGNSTPVPLVDLIALIEGEAGRKAVIEWREMQLGDVRSTYADIRRAKDLLGFVPAIKIQDGVRAFVEWFKKSRNL